MADIQFMTISSDEILKRLITGVETRLKTPLYPGDERRLFLEAIAPELVQFLNEANDNCKQRLLRHARNEVLDALGEFSDTERLAATPAETVLRFSLAEPRDRSTFIPQGTRATADGSVHFATTAAVTIPAGEVYADVSAECTTPGADYNGYGIGAISTITDLIPYVAGVTNLDVSHGGDNGEPQDYGGEGDDRYRERIRLAPAKFSTAGAESAYVYYALSASPLITAVNPINDHEAGIVELVIATGTDDPPQDVINAVVEACSKANRRPINDQLVVTGPERVEYDIVMKYYCTADNEQTAINAVESDGGAIDKFNEWQQAKIGRDLNPDELRTYCKDPRVNTGVLRLDIVSPVYTKLTERQLAKFSGNITVTHEVTEE